MRSGTNLPMLDADARTATPVLPRVKTAVFPVVRSVATTASGRLRDSIGRAAPGADIVVRPRLPYYVPHTRAYKEMAMRRGEEAAREALPALKALAEARP